MSAELAPLLAEHLPFSPVFELREYPTRAVLEQALAEQGINLCFVDCASSKEWALALLSDLVLLNPKLPVVAVHASNDSEHILKTLRQGATEFLYRPLNSDQFIAVMERVSALHRGKNPSTAKVCCFLPVKGGCGASTLAYNLAYHWKRLGAARLLLADLDPLAGTLAFLMKLKQNYTFMDALTRSGQMDEDIWRGLVHNKNGIDVLVSPEQPVHGIDEAHNPAAMIDFLRSSYDVALLDAGGPYGAWNVSLARLSDEVILVATNELPALQAAQKAIAYLGRNRLDHSKIRLVINRYQKDTGLQKELIEAALHVEVFHTIPAGYEDIQRALVDGKPVPTSTPAGKNFLQVAEKLAGKSREDSEDAAPVAKAGRLSGLLSVFRR